jgi:hypothetical protein
MGRRHDRVGGSRSADAGKCNLVTFDANGTLVWESGTPGNPGAYTHMQNDGNLVIYMPSGAVWAYR